MLIYCSHEYGGNPDNRAEAEAKITALQLADIENTYISPIHCFGHMYDKISYDAGIELCFDLLMVCDEVYVLSGVSEGVRREINMANKLGIPVMRCV